MKRVASLLIISLFCLVGIFAQDTEKKTTSYDLFISQSGKIIRFLDYKLPPLKGSYSIYNNRVRVLTAGETTTYYYQIVNTGKYGDTTGSITENDLIEMIKAIEALLTTYAIDKKSTFDYMENKFLTEDNVGFGYYISGKDSAWYVNLGRGSSDSSCFFSNGETIKNGFTTALDKIKERKSIEGN